MSEEISLRQETILALVIHEFIGAARPVGSKRLVSLYGLGVSPATVRNEMSDLTGAGLLRQPHTSAGRVPTEEGYRYFVRKLLGDTDLPTVEKRTISHQFHQAGGDVDAWLKLAASILAQHSRAASLVTAPHPERAIFKHLELISTQGRQVLMVLVLDGGEVRQQLLALEEAYDQLQLSQLAESVTQACLGKSAGAVEAQTGTLEGLGGELVQLVADLMRRTDALTAGEIYRDGLSNVLKQPEFAEPEAARSALRLLEERSFFEEVMRSVLSPNVGGVQVIIGGEGAWEDLKDCSIVIARYGAEGVATGAVGVLGPTRMAYGRSISAVRYVSRIMSDLVSEAIAGEGRPSEYPEE